MAGMSYEQMPLTVPSERDFMQLTAQRYRAMCARFYGRTDKRGRVLRIGLPVPFSLDAYRMWLQAILGDAGVTRCEYCRTPLTIQTLRTDHRTPVSRGGSLDFSNLAVVCAPCNDQKGAMTEFGFRELLRFLELPFDPADRQDLLDRLQVSTSLAIARQRALAAKYERIQIVPHRREPRP